MNKFQFGSDKFGESPFSVNESTGVPASIPTNKLPNIPKAPLSIPISGAPTQSFPNPAAVQGAIEGTQIKPDLFPTIHEVSGGSSAYSNPISAPKCDNPFGNVV